MAKTVTASQVGMIPWYSYFSSDLPRGREFYRKLFSWTVQESEMPGAGHAMFVADGAQFADLAPSDGKVPSHWASYVVVEKIADTLKRVEAMNGKILHGPMTIPQIGTMALIQDPFGGTIWAYTPEDAGTLSWAMGETRGRVCWHELMVPKPADAKAFYSEIFNWGFKAETHSAHEMWMISAGERVIGHIMKTPPQAEGFPPMWLPYFLTDAIDQDGAKVQALAGKQIMPKTEVPGMGWFSLWQDPAGAYFYFWQPK